MLPQLQVIQTNPTWWRLAVKGMRSGTARGSDGWYVDELKALPDQCFITLGEIFEYYHSREPLPEFLCKAITLPLKKRDDVQDASGTRPITLLPVIYRLWTRMTTMQILSQWSQQLPKELVGFLPGRSPANHITQVQFLFEQYHTQHQRPPAWQGITLDLVKAFNLMPRAPLAAAMTHAGIPDSLTKFWNSTQNQTQRIWRIGQTLIPQTSTSTGAPEGDTWSVLGCIALSWIWVEQMKSRQVEPSAYADNWAWKSRTLESNLAALRRTVEYTDALRLRIDWSKTWGWNLSNFRKEAWVAKIKHECPQAADLLFPKHARDLGYTLNYSKVYTRQTQKIRHTAAMSQLHKLSKTTLTLASKAKICTYAFTKALWGTTAHVVGTHWLKDLRTAATKALLPDRTSANPFLVCTFISKFLKDPEVLVILDSMRVCRIFLQQQTTEMQSTFFTMVARHDRHHSHVWGPAGALAYNLARIGWSITVDGAIRLDVEYDLHFLHSSWKEIQIKVEQAWARHLAQVLLTRDHWSNLPVPDVVATQKLFSQHNDAVQRASAVYLTGASKVGTQLKYFSEHNDQCTLCQKPDTMEHRVLHCDATAYVRANHPEVIAILQELHECNIYFPVIYADPFSDFNAWYFQHRPDPILHSEVLANIRTEISRGFIPQIFTDGTCARPEDSQFRRTAFAAVFHPVTTFTQRARQMQYFSQTQHFPDTFQVLFASEGQGVQSIPRAELLAIFHLLPLNLRCDVHTDSQYVLDTWNLLQHTLDISLLHKFANYDLLRLMHPYIGSTELRLHKVKSHFFREATDEQKLDPKYWWCLGNEVVDDAAKRALRHFELQVPLHSHHTDYKSDCVRLTQQYQYFHELQQARAIALKNLDQEVPYQGRIRALNDQIHILQNWLPDKLWMFTFQLDMIPKLDDFIWGTQYALELLEWLQMIRWPEEETDPLNAGVSWYELALSFMISTNKGIVVNSGASGMAFQPLRLDRHDVDTPFGKQVLSFERALSTLKILLGQSLWTGQRHAATSVRILGATQSKCGLSHRPDYPYRSELVEMLKDYFSTEPATPFLVPDRDPIIEVPPVDIDIQDQRNGWKHRVQRYRNLAK